MELEIASIGPFLQPLELKDRQEALRQLADRIFAQQPSAVPGRGGVTVPSALAAEAIGTALLTALGKKP